MVTALSLLLVLASAAPAKQAKQAYEKALKYSNAGEYEAALPYFQKAYELSGHRPSTIVALAQCERELKLFDKALEHFREYLALKPAPKDASKIEQTVAILEDLRDEQAARRERERKELERKEREEKKAEVAVAPPPPPPPEIQPPPPPPPAIAVETTPEPESESIWESPVFWGVTAGVVVAVAVGVTLGVTLQPEAELYGGTTGVLLE